MEIFTVFGLTIFLLVVMVVTSVLFNMTLRNSEYEQFDCLGFIAVMFVLSIIFSLFFTQPERFGYEKMVSNNSVEQEVEE